MPAPKNLTDSYEFLLTGGDIKSPIKGYVSSIDPTNTIPEILIQGSQNVYKKLSGTVANRPGRLLRGTIDATLAGVLASWEWMTSLGNTLPLRVCNGNLQVESNIADGSTFVWYTLLSSLTLTRFVFDAWWDSTAQKDTLVFVNGDSTIKTWSGGIAKITSTTAAVAGGVLTASVTAGGSGYKVGDVLTISGGSTPATLTVTTTDGSGAVTAFRLETAGSGYSTGAGQGTTGGFMGSSGCTINVLTVGTVGTITVSGTKSWGQMGFASSGSLVINGHTYSYAYGADTFILQGVTPDPSGEAVNSIAIQTVVTNTTPANSTVAGLPAAGYNNDFLKVIGNRVHIGSYTSREIFISSSADLTNYTVPSPRTSGSPELLILDNTAKGISVSKGNAFIAAGTKDWYEVVYSQLTVSSVATEQTQVVKQPTSENSAALAHEFIDTVGDNIIYLAQDQQVRELGIWRNLVSPKPPILSQQVYTELYGETFIQGNLIGQLRAVDDFVYITTPISGRTYLYQTRTDVDAVGNVVAERLWHPPQEWGASKVAVINGVTFIHSNANPQIYQIWNTNQWHDDSPSGPVSYDSRMKMAYRNYGRRQGMWQLNRIYIEGYMTQGTALNGNHYVEFEGGRTTQTFSVNSAKHPARFFSSSDSASLGDSSLGDNPLGDGLDTLGIGEQDLPKFKTIRGLNPANFTEHTFEFYSENLDDRWEILCFGANITVAQGQQAGFLMS